VFDQERKKASRPIRGSTAAMSCALDGPAGEGPRTIPGVDPGWPAAWPVCRKILASRVPFPSAVGLTLGGRVSSPRARKDTREIILFFLVFFSHFFSEAFPYYLKLLVQVWENLNFF